MNQIAFAEKHKNFFVFQFPVTWNCHEEDSMIELIAKKFLKLLVSSSCLSSNLRLTQKQTHFKIVRKVWNLINDLKLLWRHKKLPTIHFQSFFIFFVFVAEQPPTEFRQCHFKIHSRQSAASMQSYIIISEKISQIQFQKLLWNSRECICYGEAEIEKGLETQNKSKPVILKIKSPISSSIFIFFELKISLWSNNSYTVLNQSCANKLRPRRQVRPYVQAPVHEP